MAVNISHDLHLIHSRMSMGVFSTYGYPLLSANSIFANFATWQNVFVASTTALSVFSWSFLDMRVVAQSSQCVCFHLRLSKATSTCLFWLSPCQQVSFGGLFSATVFAFGAFCWWFRCLKWSLSIVLKCCVGFLSVRRLGYVLLDELRSGCCQEFKIE